MKGISEDVALKRQDSIVVKSISELHAAYFVSIFGQINLSPTTSTSIPITSP
ncbi:MAG: hypothetical protein R2822_06750 [Spirosomataceae bacterium]